jgi:Kef-type K+ transport system membrane component KefB
MHGATFPLPVAMLIVFGSAKLVGEVFARLHLPPLAGEIVAGALVGPSMLGWIAPNEVLRALSDLGVLFLLFSIGLEVKVGDLLRVSAVAAAVATVGELAPFAAGWAVFAKWGAAWGAAGGGTAGTRNEAMFVGAALVATSVGITASVLAEQKLLGEGASQVILAAAVIDDILGLLVLAVVSSVAGGHGRLAGVFLTAVLAMAFMAVIAFWGPALVRRWLPAFRSRARADEAEFHIALLLLFALAAVALYTGVAAIVGAFLAGLALAVHVDKRVRTLTRGVSELLVPFFLAGIGLNFDAAIFRSKGTAGLAFLVLVAAIASKVLGCGGAALGLGWQNAVRVGVGMVPRGEVAMIAAQLGLTTAVLSATAYSVIVFVVVGTALVTPLLLQITFAAQVRQASRQQGSPET